MSRKKSIAILAIILMVLTLMPAAVFGADDSDRIAGSNRIETALKICDEGWDSADTVILAPADTNNLVDALAAAPLAGQEDAPILLTYKNELNAAVKAKIADLGASKVYVIGAISDAVKDAVAAIDGVSVEKLSGANRWETADAINAKLTNPAGSFVVGYNAIADALSVASFAAANGYAIVLTKADGTVDASKLKGDKTYLIGGTAVVKDYAGAEDRFSGADRYATNKAVAEAMEFDWDVVYVANGVSLVDALAVAPLAAKDGAFVALASASDVPAASYVNGQLSATSKVIAVGGTSAVPASVLAKVGFESSEPQVVAVVAKSYDDDTSGQYVEFTVNGKKADITALNADGWDVEFSARSAKYGGTDVTNNLFADVTTGLLKNNLTAGTDYYVQVVLTKGADIIASELTKIQIKNLNLTASSISEYKLSNDNATGSSSDDFDMESTKLVVGETATFYEITVAVGSAKEVVTSGFALKTSDAGVISKSGTSIYAEAPGTATITITYGGATKDINFTVVNDQRKIDKVRIKALSDLSVISSVKFAAANGGTHDVKAEALDQFGDPVIGGIKRVDSSNTGVATVTYTGTTLTITKVSQGSATINFYNATSGGTKIGSLSVTTSNNIDVSKKSFDLWKPATNDQANNIVSGATKPQFSTDTTIDVSDDKYIVYTLNQFNSDNLPLGASSNISYDIAQSPSDAVTGSLVDSGKKVLITANKPGSATLKVTDNDTGKIYTVKITVIDEAYSIKSVNWKSIASPTYAKTFTWKSALNFTETGNDPILDGITLNKAASQVIRFDASNAILYIDKNANGTYQSGTDINLGKLEMTTSGSFTNSVSGLSINVVAGDEGTIIWKIWNPAQTKVLASKSVSVEL